MGGLHHFLKNEPNPTKQAHRTMSVATQTASRQLSAIIHSGRTASAFTEHRAAGFTDPHGFSRKPAVGSGVLNLRELFVMPPASATGHTVTFNKSPVVVNRSTPISLAAAVIENCLVAKAGASVIVAAQRNMAGTETHPVLYRDAGLFRVVEPATFGGVADGADAGAGATPWHDSLIEWPTAPSVAYRTTLSRASQKAVGGGEMLEENMLEAIIAGLAEAADRTLLAAIVEATPAAFTLAAAAARGLRFGHLAALVGTTGQGAAVGADGTLRAAGIPAELTRTVASTVVGDFRKAAVAIHPELTVHVERISVNGEIGFSVFANMLPLVPDASAFWLGA